MSLISVDDLEEGREVVGRVSWGMKEFHDVFFGAFSLCPRYSLCWMEVDRKEYSVLELSLWPVTVLRG